ncbi:uncharacterized protein sb:cb288 [Cyprinodon tularosa]|uniref:uncharacterized protein sb:cb288 n=1 Tax=Cyprinodon tularosa TaxID=77115 RepID=UPI0018E22865|nr:uncharacterized protein sb:cb288 [Cyprinodon tularosa]
MIDPNLREEPLNLNVTTAVATHSSQTEDSLTRSSGIIPGTIAASVFIAFLLALYATLWKCMMSPPTRKKSKRRIRAQQKRSSLQHL